MGLTRKYVFYFRQYFQSTELDIHADIAQLKYRKSSRTFFFIKLDQTSEIHNTYQLFQKKIKIKKLNLILKMKLIMFHSFKKGLFTDKLMSDLLNWKVRNSLEVVKFS